MSHVQALDIRTPIGGLFVILGALLVVYGVMRPENAHGAIGGNIDRDWGFVMLAFGALFLILARTGRRAAGARTAAASPEGRAVEAREHRTGLEDERR